MTPHKEQPAVDTSAEAALRRARTYIETKGTTTIEGTLVADGDEVIDLIDAALRSLAAHPAEPQVERAQKAEAALAALKQPVSDEEVETIARALDSHQCSCGGSCGQQVPQEIGYAADLLRRLYRRIESFEADGDAHKARLATIRRHEDLIRDLTAERDALSTQLRDAQARSKGLEGALHAIDDLIEGLGVADTRDVSVNKIAVIVFNAIVDTPVEADATLSRPEGSAST